MIRALVVDDEQPARERLGRLLSAFDDVEIVDEAEDGEGAMERIARLRPDVVFLDIQMPGCSGMEVVASLPAPRPRIVFCTAYDAYAVDAFELHAVDYLLKPVTLARLEKAVLRLREPGAGPEIDESLARAGREPGTQPSRFLAKRGNRYHVVQAAEVLCFMSEGSLTKLRTAADHYWMEPTLNDLESRLDPARFFRVSRSAIVNLDALREVVPLGSGLAEVALGDGSRLEVSRRRLKELMERLR
jgi:two-component system LytT family response regulator